MPVLDPPDYKPPWLLRNPHFNTIFPNRFRKVEGVNYQRERVPTPDGDYLDLDFDQRGNDTLLVVVHGLEGSSNSYYVRGLIKVGLTLGWDGLGLNLRGCSGTPNQTFGAYHSGMTDDLHTALEYVWHKKKYQNILLAGFSLGGNLVLKYTGEKGKELDASIRAVACVSVPTHLEGSARQLSWPQNRIYLLRFLRQLKRKVRDKQLKYPDSYLTKKDIDKVRSFHDFDDLYTAPAHGFEDAIDYWERNSANAFIANIARPTLLLNAQDDTFLSPECYPFELAKNHPQFHLMVTNKGGHVGFMQSGNTNTPPLHETVVIEFLEQHLSL